VPCEQGLSDWRVYSAEQAVGINRDLEADECEVIVEKATSSGWFQNWFPDAPPIELIIGGHEDPEFGLIGSHAQQYGYPRPTKWVISMHPKMLTARILFHELAHCVAPIYVAEDFTGRRRSGVPDVMMRSKHRVHGECFTAALGVITDNLLPGDDGELAAAYRHYDVPISTLQELREQLADQPSILDDEQAFYDGIRRDNAEIDEAYEAEHGESQKAWIPSVRWGWCLEDTRRMHHRRAGGRLLSQKAVAERISKVTPCNARHIAALEDSQERPEDPAQLKRAMLMAIFLGLDPIWVRYNLRLTRWDCGSVTMRQARIMNYRWAKLISHMNKQLREMPPRWRVEGER
jgi:hypothetical protein